MTNSLAARYIYMYLLVFSFFLARPILTMLFQLNNHTPEVHCFVTPLNEYKTKPNKTMSSEQRVAKPIADLSLHKIQLKEHRQSADTCILVLLPFLQQHARGPKTLQHAHVNQFSAWAGKHSWQTTTFQTWHDFGRFRCEYWTFCGSTHKHRKWTNVCKLNCRLTHAKRTCFNE